MRGGSQHVRATVREPLDWRSWQACRLAAFATRNPFEPLRLMDTHDAGVAVSAAVQCASTHTPPAVALAKARKRTAAASKPAEVSSAPTALSPAFLVCTDDCSASLHTAAVLAQAGACEADSLFIPPHAAAPAGSCEPRTAEPRSALTTAYAYGPHLRCTAQGPMRVAQMHRRCAASVLPSLWYLLLGVLAVGARGMAEIAIAVCAATRGHPATRPPPHTP
jgi:hypothetical protein